MSAGLELKAVIESVQKDTEALAQEAFPNDTIEHERLRAACISFAAYTATIVIGRMLKMADAGGTSIALIETMAQIARAGILLQQSRITSHLSQINKDLATVSGKPIV